MRAEFIAFSEEQTYEAIQLSLAEAASWAEALPAARRASSAAEEKEDAGPRRSKRLRGRTGYGL